MDLASQFNPRNSFFLLDLYLKILIIFLNIVFDFIYCIGYDVSPDLWFLYFYEQKIELLSADLIYSFLLSKVYLELINIEIFLNADNVQISMDSFNELQTIFKNTIKFFALPFATKLLSVFFTELWQFDMSYDDESESETVLEYFIFYFTSLSWIFLEFLEIISLCFITEKVIDEVLFLNNCY